MNASIFFSQSHWVKTLLRLANYKENPRSKLPDDKPKAEASREKALHRHLHYTLAMSLSAEDLLTKWAVSSEFSLLKDCLDNSNHEEMMNLLHAGIGHSCPLKTYAKPLGPAADPVPSLCAGLTCREENTGQDQCQKAEQWWNPPPQGSCQQPQKCAGARFDQPAVSSRCRILNDIKKPEVPARPAGTNSTNAPSLVANPLLHVNSKILFLPIKQ